MKFKKYILQILYIYIKLFDLIYKLFNCGIWIQTVKFLKENS